MVRIIHRLATCLKECSHPPRISHSSIIVFPCVCVCVFQLIHHLWPFIPSLLRIYSGNQDPGSHSFLPPPHATACRLENRHIRQNGLSTFSAKSNRIAKKSNVGTYAAGSVNTAAKPGAFIFPSCCENARRF